MLADTIDILRDLIAFPTVSSDSNLGLIVHLAARLTDAGARVELMHDETGQKANLFATLGPEGDGGIVLSGHTDVVPVAEQEWSTDPFEMTERDGRLYGRGSCDMKGFLACCLAALPLWSGRDLARPLHFAFTYDEEVGCVGAMALAAQLAGRGLRPAMALVGEPTGMAIIDGHKGVDEYTVEFTGLEGHGSAPDRGVNAGEYAVRYVARLLELREELKTRAPEGSPFDPPHSTLNLGRISGGVAHNVIIGRAEVEWDLRPVQGADRDFVRDALDRLVRDDLLPAMRAVAPDADIVTHVIGQTVGLEPRAHNAARDLLAGSTGRNGTETAAFGTEAGIFQQTGMDVAVCGPGDIAQAHKPDEYVEIAELARCLDMLRGLTPYLIRSGG
ncbi:acetylornithine deacetylase [Mesobaculum littorinae]|uniref:Acetylornithine deacetylase n=2 Tax=Mesobaculum littorinae TaxID=2486419 RepID=A0A438AHR7_9RHOB|nr:acetylornithine deacetylase [Mesobaculum littorinae]